MKCAIHKEKEDSCIKCWEAECEELKSKVKFWNSAWHEQRVLTGKNYWMIPNCAYKLTSGEPWNPESIKMMSEVYQQYRLVQGLLDNFFYMLTWTKPEPKSEAWYVGFNSYAGQYPEEDICPFPDGAEGWEAYQFWLGWHAAQEQAEKLDD